MVQENPYTGVVLTYRFDASGARYAVDLGINGSAAVTYWYLYNAQGDVVGLADKTGAVVARYTYDAWGKVLSITDADGNEIDANRYAYHIGHLNPIRYRGYYYDVETGLYLTGTRYYDPIVGRFISPDVEEALTQEHENMAQYNLYAYCWNNPVNMTDEDGTWPQWAKNIAKVAVGAVAIGIGVAATVATGGAAAPALIAAVKVAAVSAAIGAGTGAVSGAVSHRVSTGSWKGAGKAALNGGIDGAASGFMAGGIMAGSSQVASAGFKVAAKVSVNAGKPVSSGIKLSKNVKILSPDKLYHKTNGGTLLKIGKTFRLDINSYTMLHVHLPGPFAGIHFPIGTIGAGLYGGLKR